MIMCPSRLSPSLLRLSRTITLVGPLLLLMAVTACFRQPVVSEGLLRGVVTIGPLTPFLREGEPPPTPSPEIFAPRKVMVYAVVGGRKLIAEVDIEPPGRYRVSLPAGICSVDIDHLSVDSAKGLPRNVTIIPGEIAELDIDIDTGIR